MGHLAPAAAIVARVALLHSRHMADDEHAGVPLATMRFIGERFETQGIPVDVLDEARICQQILLSRARNLYLQDHPETARVPPGFEADHRVRLLNIEEGSSVMVFVADRDPSKLAMKQDHYLESAAEEVSTLIDTGSSEDDSRNGKLDYSDFSRFGHTLEKNDQMLFRAGQASAVLDYQGVRRLHARARVKRDQPQRSPTVRVGTVNALDAPSKTIQLQSIESAAPETLEYESEAVFAHLRDAIEFERTGRTFVVCLPQASPQNGEADDERHSVDMVSRAEVVRDEKAIERYGTICERLRSFSHPSGRQSTHAEDRPDPSEAACDVARELVGHVLCAALPLPYVYPLPEGGVSLEWGLNTIGINAEVLNDAATIDLMLWHRSDDKTSDAEFRSSDLNAVSDWLTQQIGQ